MDLLSTDLGDSPEWSHFEFAKGFRKRRIDRVPDWYPESCHIRLGEAYSQQIHIAGEIFKLENYRTEASSVLPASFADIKTLPGSLDLSTSFENALMGHAESESKGLRFFFQNAYNNQLRRAVGLPGLPNSSNQNAYLNSTESFTHLHKKNMNLQSTNVLWYGQPVVWLVVPSRHACKLEAQVARALQVSPTCSQFVGHTAIVIPPSLLARWGINFSIFVQFSGDVVQTDYGAYCAKWSMGVNLGEEVSWSDDPSWQPPPLYRHCCNRCAICPHPANPRHDTAISTVNSDSAMLAAGDQASGDFSMMTAEEQSQEGDRNLETAYITVFLDSTVDMDPAIEGSDLNLNDMDHNPKYVDHNLNDMDRSLNDMDHNLNDMDHNLNDMDHNLNDMDHNLNDMDHNLNDMDHNLNDMDHNLNDMDHNLNDMDHNLNDIDLECLTALRKEIESAQESIEPSLLELNATDFMDNVSNGVLPTYIFPSPSCEPNNASQCAGVNNDLGFELISRDDGQENSGPPSAEAECVFESMVLGESTPTPTISTPPSNSPARHSETTQLTSWDGASQPETLPHRSGELNSLQLATQTSLESSKPGQLQSPTRDFAQEIEQLITSGLTRERDMLWKSGKPLDAKKTLGTFRASTPLDADAIMETLLILASGRDEVRVVSSVSFRDALAQVKSARVSKAGNLGMLLLPVNEVDHCYLVALDAQKQLVTIHDNETHEDIEKHIFSGTGNSWKSSYKQVRELIPNLSKALTFDRYHGMMGKDVA